MLSLCETVAAITVHARYLTSAGRKPHGGADTETLCGMKAAWDLNGAVTPENVRCRECRMLLPREGAKT